MAPVKSARGKEKRAQKRRVEQNIFVIKLNSQECVHNIVQSFLRFFSRIQSWIQSQHAHKHWRFF